MNAQLLEAKLSTTITKKTVIIIVRELKNQRFSIKELIDLTFHTRPEIGFRAAWILENYVLGNKTRLLPILPYFLKKFTSVNNPSCKRHYAKILQEITFHLNDKKADPIFQHEILNSDLEGAVETCFDWLIDAKVAIAVKVFCMESLFNMSTKHPWIIDELALSIEFIMKDGSAAIRSRGKKILRLLKLKSVR